MSDEERISDERQADLNYWVELWKRSSNAVIGLQDDNSRLVRERDDAVAENARLLARIAAVEAFCKGRAIGARARGDSESERAWLDALIVSERAALAATPTGPEATTKPKRCAGTLGDRPSWMSPGQFSPCRCELMHGHDGECQCEHTRPATPAEPTEETS